MRQKQFLWHIRPGFSVVDVMRAFRDHGIHALKVYDSQISTRKNLGSKAVRITVTVEHDGIPERGS